MATQGSEPNKRKGSRSTRIEVQLSDELRKRLTAYALGAGAAGVGLLALSPAAKADIIFTPAYIELQPNQSLNLDLNHDGIPDFRIFDSGFFFSAKDLKVRFPPSGVALWPCPGRTKPATAAFFSAMGVGSLA